MIDEPTARELAKADFEADGTEVAVLGNARELELGWFFPVITKERDIYSSVIVDKGTGRVLRVIGGSLDRDPTLYDRGYQYEVYDIVVLSVANLDETVSILVALHEVTVDVYYRYGRVYRVGRGLTEAEVRARLQSLPAVFSGRATFMIERFEEARQKGWFEFKTFEYRGKK